MMVETYLLRGKRRLEKLTNVPAVRTAGTAGLYGLSGFLLSGASLWGTMQPAAMGFVAGSLGWRCLCAALGSAAGYRIFWPEQGLQGMIWVLGGLVLALVLPFFGGGAYGCTRLAGGAACLVSAVGLAFQYAVGENIGPLPFLLRIFLAAACTALWVQARESHGRVGQWLVSGAAILAVCQLPVPNWMNPGLIAAGAFAAAVPLPGAALAGLAADISGRTAIPVTGVCCLAFFWQQLPIRESRRRMLSPAAACVSVMLLYRRIDWGALAAISTGGILSNWIPWRFTVIPRHGGLGAAQVQLEQSAGVLAHLQLQLLEYSPPRVDCDSLLEQLEKNACGRCPFSESCETREELTEDILDGSGELRCRKPNLLQPELRQSRDRYRRLLYARSMETTLRRAMVQQYGFLTDLLREVSDRLTERETKLPAVFRVQVSARSQGKELADGDMVTAFPGLRSRFYVLLCDGMGTGLGAAEEGRQASRLLKRMLCAGIPAQNALGSLNAQLVLLGKGGAVTVDLAEIRLDLGTVWVYKWGANPSWVLHRGQAEQLGHAGAPPGLDVEESRFLCVRADLSRGQVLVMTSDGVGAEHVQEWAALPDQEPGDLAAAILQSGGSREDDSTAVVIKLTRNGTK